MKLYENAENPDEMQWSWNFNAFAITVSRNLNKRQGSDGHFTKKRLQPYP